VHLHSCGLHPEARITERGFEYDSKAYDGPSPAAVAAKLKAGASQSAAPPTAGPSG
jgi:hypothetical protein